MILKNLYKTALLLLVVLFSCKTKVAEKEYIRTGYFRTDEIRNEKSNFPWFSERYENYTPEENVISRLKMTDKNLTFLIFAGEWCSDTRKLLPEYYKVTDMAGIVNQQLYFLDRNKQSPDKLEKSYNITLVPTFIVIKNGKEIGRIEESVDSNIETELLEIILSEENNN